MDAAEDEPEVANTRLLEEVENAVLFRAEWAPTAEIISGLKQLDVTIIESEGTSERWKFEVRAEEREQLMEFLEIFQAQEIAISMDRLYDLAEVVEMDRRSLTYKQRDTLLTAFQKGYFEKPREVTQEELATEFDISTRAVSERLRRANRNLIENSLLPSGDRL